MKKDDIKMFVAGIISISLTLGLTYLIYNYYINIILGGLFILASAIFVLVVIFLMVFIGKLLGVDIE